MPKMGISVSEGTIVEWRKEVGERVEADETIAEVTTDKVDVEIPAPASGVVAKLLAEAGETVAVGEPIAEIGGPPAAAAEPGCAGAERSRRSRASAETRRGRPLGVLLPGRPADRRQARHRPDDGRGDGSRRPRPQEGRLKRMLEPASRRTALRPTLHTESPYRPDEPAPANGNGNGAHREPMSPMRSAIARHMVESLRTSAHCTTVVEVDMSAVARKREAAARGDGAPRRAADAARVRRRGDGRRARRAPDPQLVDRGRGDRRARRRPSRDRGRARRRA